MSINRNLATFAKDVQTDGTLEDSSVRGISVTVTVAGGKFVIDGTSQQTMFIPKGVKYRFDVSDSSVSGHPLVFSETSDGTHGGGSAYTTGITTSGTAGSSGAYVEVQLQQDAPDLLYYYCSNHSGMGAGAETAPQGSSYGNSDVDSHLNQSNPTSGYVLSWNGSDYAWVDNAGYTDSDVNTHLNVSGASSGQILSWNGSDYAWIADSDTSGIDNLSEDSTPQLGGDLDVNGNSIVSASNGDISITPNGSGKVIIDGLSHPTSDGSANQVLKTDGSGNLSFVDQSSGGIASVAADTTPQLGGDLDVNGNAIVSASNGNIAITPDGTGKIILDGLSFPTADGSADQVLKTDGSGNLSFVAQSSGGGGGSLTATASGALSNGQLIVVNSDGTVSPVYQTNSAATGSLTTYESATATYTRAAYDANSGKVVIAYRDDGNNYYGTAVVGTVSGSTISFGTPVVFESANAQGLDIAYDTNAQKVVIAYRDAGDNNYGTAIVGTVSGSSISFGSAVVFGWASCYDFSCTYDTSAQKILIASHQGFTSGKAIVGTISGTSISFGSEATFDSTGSASHLISAYDENAGKHLIAWQASGNNNYGTAIVATISGTSVSFGSASVFESNAVSYQGMAYDANAQKCVISYRASSTGKAVVASISGTSVSFGTPVTFASANSTYTSAVYHSGAQKVIITYADAGNSSYPTYIVGTVSNTSISFDAEVAFGSDASNYHASVYDSGQGKVVFAANIGNNGKAVVYSPAYNVANLTAENFVGISDGAYSSGATATIQTAGSTDDAQSGLTAGQSYYVQADGTLGLSPDTIEVLAGTAVSATEILINPDTNPATFGVNQVDAHLNVSTATSGQILSWNGSDYAWADDQGGLNVVSSHSQTLSSDTTVAATDNAMSVGPLTVASGVTLTVASGARYVVV